MDSGDDKKILKLLREKHVKYCLRCLQILPQASEAFDSTRLVIAFFAISTLDLLNSLSVCSNEKSSIIDWVYSLQVSYVNSSKKKICGFRGSTSCTVTCNRELDMEYFDEPHIAMTYAALATLLILGDDLERVDKKGIVDALKELQLPDGSFRPMHSESENDMRFIYCASCVSYILQDWSGIDVDKAVKYIQDSITYEGGIAQGPGLEAHGGSTFCAVASLWLMNKLETVLSYEQLKRLKQWCLFRQVNGFQSRPNKPTDSCYTFWIGATLKLLDCYDYFNHDELRQYVLCCQSDVTGGMSKWIDESADPLHTYFGIGGLSLIQCDKILTVHSALNISQRAAAHLENLHKSWQEKNDDAADSEKR